VLGADRGSFVDPALFPDRQAEWAERLGSSQRLGAMAIRLTDKEDVAPPTRPDPEIAEARDERLIADLVEPARAEALEDLGQGATRLRDRGQVGAREADKRPGSPGLSARALVVIPRACRGSSPAEEGFGERRSRSISSPD
jgi:hypothetical protein